jgi:hypothetical protein
VVASGSGQATRPFSIPTGSSWVSHRRISPDLFMQLLKFRYCNLNTMSLRIYKKRSIKIKRVYDKVQIILLIVKRSSLWHHQFIITQTLTCFSNLDALCLTNLNNCTTQSWHRRTALLWRPRGENNGNLGITRRKTHVIWQLGGRETKHNMLWVSAVLRP